MRRRLLQLLVVLLAVGAVVATAPTASADYPWLWCVEWEACENAPPCVMGLSHYNYVMCCTILDYCESWSGWSGNCC